MQASHSKIGPKTKDFRTFLGKSLGQFWTCLVLNLGQFRTLWRPSLCKYIYQDLSLKAADFRDEWRNLKKVSA